MQNYEHAESQTTIDTGGAAEGAGASKADAFEAALTAVADVVKDKATKVNDPNASAAQLALRKSWIGS